MAVVLHHFKASGAAPHLSPFCFKAATFMRLAGIEYESAVWDPGSAPLGKAPVVELDGQLIADSSTILLALTEHFDVQLDAAYTSQELALGHAVRRMLEEHSYWAVMHVRWLDDAGWAAYRPVIANSLPLPGPFATVLSSYIRRQVKNAAHQQGLSRHPPAEIERRGIEDLQAVEALLSDRVYLLGDTPCSHDATVYAWLESLLHPLFTSPLRDHVEQSATLLPYVKRVRALAWPDWDFPT